MFRKWVPVVAALALSQVALADEITIDTAQGEVTLPAIPERVVVYSAAAADTLNALGVSMAGLPGNLKLPWLAELNVAPVGTLFEADLEKLAGIDPDLVIVGERSSSQLEQTSQVATTIDMSISADLLSDAKSRIGTYGTLFGKQAAAEKLEAELDANLEKLQQAAEGKGTALVMLTNGPKMSAYGLGSRFGWIHDATGMEPAIADLDNEARHGNALSHELIAEANPDWIFVLDRGAAIGADSQAAAQTLDGPLVASTTAWSEGQVVYLPPSELYIGGGGYQAMSAIIDALTGALQGADGKNL